MRHLPYYLAKNPFTRGPLMGLQISNKQFKMVIWENSYWCGSGSAFILILPTDILVGAARSQRR